MCWGGTLIMSSDGDGDDADGGSPGVMVGFLLKLIVPRGRRDGEVTKRVPCLHVHCSLSRPFNNY
jgi:hypothetical protein